MPRSRPPADSIAVGALLTLMIALGQLSTAIYVPSLPSLVDALHTTRPTVTLTFTVFLAGFAVAQLVFGPLSDRFGRRVTLLGGVALFFAASVACAMAPNVETLILARLFQSMGACSGAVVGRAVVRDAYGPVRAAKAFAYIGVAFSLSPAISPTIGGFLQEWFGWRSSFVFLAGAGAFTLLIGHWMLDETNRFPDPTALDPIRMACNFKALLLHPVFVANMAAVSLLFSGLMAFVAGAPFLFIEVMHVSPSHYGMYVGVSALGTLVGNLAAGRWSIRFGTRRMILAGIVLALGAGAVMIGLAGVGLRTPIAIVAPVLVFLIGMGIVISNGMAGAMAPFPRMAGAASALMGCAQMGVAALAGSAVGHIVLATQMPLALVMFGLAVAALTVFVICYRIADRRGSA